MRKFLMGFLILGTLATHAQEITVRSSRQQNNDFSGYKTYAFASQVDHKLDQEFYFLNDLIFKAMVREAVKGELEGLGYRYNATSPDVVVNFRVFEQPATLRGVEGYGSSYWGNATVNNATDLNSYDVEAGTLIISLIDRKAGALVWQGFASGLIDNNQFIKDEGRVREAVNLIFDEYGVRATDYTKR